MQNVKSITVVINPAAGDNIGARIRPELERLFVELFPTRAIDFIEPGSKERAQALGANLRSDLIVMVSGDGTLHDLAQGVLSRPRLERPALSIIPIGSGNDYARTLGVSSDPLTAVRALRDGVRINTDVGRCNQTWYLETLSYGVDAAAAANTIELRKTTHSSEALLYAHAAVLAILTELKPHRARYVIDGQPHQDDLLILAVQNGPTYGGGFKVAPRASITDGYLDICMATKVSRLKALYLLARVFSGKHEQCRQFQTYRARSLTIDFDETVPAQCDGEPQQGRHFEISVHPQALDLIVPNDSPVLGASSEAWE
jgi:YegS/Rv2252/BmrU family lipid kinase